MIQLTTLPMKLRAAMSLCGAAVFSFLDPALPCVALCTSLVVADFISARMLARRVRRLAGDAASESTKFSSRRFGDTVVTLLRIYALILLAHAVDCVILDAGSTAAMRFASGIVCFWQTWSIIENEASANNAAWARMARKILVDKTQRHLGGDLPTLLESDTRDD